MTAPRFNRDDTVYLASSAAIGQLEGYRVTDARQTRAGKWVYKITFTKNPPMSALIGDTFDGKKAHPTIFFNEADLLPLCEAIDLALTRVSSRILKLETRQNNICDDETDAIVAGNPKYAIGDSVYFHTSARVGFLERGVVKGIYETGVQTGSRQRRYEYQVRFSSPNSLKLLFREDELIAFCDALALVLAFLYRKRDELTAQRDSLCEVV